MTAAAQTWRFVAVGLTIIVVGFAALLYQKSINEKVQAVVCPREYAQAIVTTPREGTTLIYGLGFMLETAGDVIIYRHPSQDKKATP